MNQTTTRIQKAIIKLRSELRLAEENAANHRHMHMRDYYRGRAKAIKQSLSLVEMAYAELQRLRDEIELGRDKLVELTERVQIACANAKQTREVIRKGTPG